MKLFYLGLGLCLLTWTCSSDQPAQVERDVFFDLGDFIEDHIGSSDSLVSVNKSIRVDENLESKDLSDYPIHLDIEGFSTLDINKAALWDKYQVDTLNKNTTLEITYSALDPQLTVQSMILVQKERTVETILIEMQNLTFLADVYTSYRWEPSTGYKIIKREDKIFSEPSVHEIVVTLQNKP